MNLTSEQAKNLSKSQLAVWELAQKNYKDLTTVKSKEIDIDGFKIKVQFNPARIQSSAAKVDAKSIQERKCFLCPANLPAVQTGLTWRDEYQILVNPFPIFPEHFTIPTFCHTDQLILDRFQDMLDLAKQLDSYTLFYNGPKCGASAPDHAHFQAGSKGFMPIEADIKKVDKDIIHQEDGLTVYAIKNYHRNSFLIEAKDSKKANSFFKKLYSLLEIKAGEQEPMMNIITWYESGIYYSIVLPREVHRPACFFAEGDDNILISPASVDLGGVFITPQEKDFEKISEKDIRHILKEICLSDDKFDKIISQITNTMEPKISVGILWNNEISFSLSGGYTLNGKKIEGKQKVTSNKGQILWNGENYKEIIFDPQSDNSSFEIIDVVIGINFHWERKENQVFQGALKLIVENDIITAINILGVEDYLTSVISSEMSANASLELLKAHAVISRSWLLAQVEKNNEIVANKTDYSAFTETATERIRWYDREDHTTFDVCADDHCQRYQGITRASANIEIVKQAIKETWGQVLTSEGKICDARFSKCCGGVVEEFQNCWENIKHPYLVKLRDAKNSSVFPDLTIEVESENWIISRPDAFCNTQDKKILSQVLNNYDQETTDFYRWSVTYGQDELSELVKERSGIDFGTIEDLIPVERGTSSRLIKLRIVGSKLTMTIGKELEIRRILSKSHLYSSAFVVEKKDKQFTLIGAGWGHGVGLCQIGAAVMGEQGYPYSDILLHYYVDASIEKKY